ncbi:hypothetical protein Rcae01_03700 [Novipirellula caenicola]|uniref:Uncharacterized protein n=1 Tax=Novipirellula caenicola TaxID=1536901 RepID=A0ABP9VSV9_9BACT
MENLKSNVSLARQTKSPNPQRQHSSPTRLPKTAKFTGTDYSIESFFLRFAAVSTVDRFPEYPKDANGQATPWAAH